MRKEFGFARTKCDCEQCRVPCKFMPGYLVPSDLARIKNEIAGHRTIEQIAEDWFLASPGAIVKKDGRMFRIPTIVPQTEEKTGHCIFLDEQGLCKIHEVAPYGCAFFDFHMTDKEGDCRSKAGLTAIVEDFQNGGIYSTTWRFLAKRGLVAPDSIHQRAKMEAAISQLESFPLKERTYDQNTSKNSGVNRAPCF